MFGMTRSKVEEYDDVENSNAEEEEDYHDVEEEDWYFARVCAIHEHLHTLQAPFCRRL